MCSLLCFLRLYPDDVALSLSSLTSLRDVFFFDLCFPITEEKRRIRDRCHEKESEKDRSGPDSISSNDLKVAQGQTKVMHVAMSCDRQSHFQTSKGVQGHFDVRFANKLGP